MKKKLLLLATLLGVTFGMEAQTLSVDNNSFVGLRGKSATLSVKVNQGSTDLRDVVFDIVIPEGVTFNPDAVTTAADGYTVACAAVTGETNKYKVILYSAPTKDSGKQPSTIGAGVTIDFPLTIPANFADSKLWKPSLTPSSTSEGSATYMASDAVKEIGATSTAYTFEVGLLADVNKDGKVNSTDTSAEFDYIAAHATPASLGSFSVVVNVNGDSSINSTDISALFDIIAASGNSVKAEAGFEEKSAADDEETNWAD